MQLQLQIEPATDLNAVENVDGVLLVTDALSSVHDKFSFLRAPFDSQAEWDNEIGKSVVAAKLDGKFKRVIFSPTGPLNRDYDDERRFYEAAVSGIKRALSAGCKSIALVTIENKQHVHAQFSAAMGAAQALYVPLEIREAIKERETKMSRLVVWRESTENMDAEKLVAYLKAYEKGKIIARDIGGSDPERMAAPNVAKYVEEVYAGTSIKVSVISDRQTIEKEYPCLAAVDRCATVIPRHNARVIKLEYEGEGPITDTLLLVGKGVTYDTGGADVKAGGVMAGMHRDKCGAAAVGGFFHVLNDLKPKNLKVIGTMAMVRNSIGANCYVADEIITNRAGVRVRVGNTDAEGRMAMVDCLCEAKERALNEVNPQLYTIATLTGHCIVAYGQAYFAAMDNGPARKANNAKLLQESGDLACDPCEISTVRREDFEFVKGKSEYEDVLQCNNSPSSRTPRGHQFPCAFMTVGSGMDKHGNDSSHPIKYTHLDIAGSSGPFPGVPTGSPIAALSMRHIKHQK